MEFVTWRKVLSTFEFCENGAVVLIDGNINNLEYSIFYGNPAGIITYTGIMLSQKPSGSLNLNWTKKYYKGFV